MARFTQDDLDLFDQALATRSPVLPQDDFQRSALQTNPAPQPIEPGNIDPSTRPVVKNPDGSISTLRSSNFNIDGQEVLLPTIEDDGRQLTPQESVDRYRATGQHLGKFATPEDSDAFARNLSAQQGWIDLRPRGLNPLFGQDQDNQIVLRRSP